MYIYWFSIYIDWSIHIDISLHYWLGISIDWYIVYTIYINIYWLGIYNPKCQIYQDASAAANPCWVIHTSIVRDFDTGQGNESFGGKLQNWMIHAVIVHGLGSESFAEHQLLFPLRFANA